MIELAGAARSVVMEVIVIGIIATFAADLWQRLVQTIAGLPPANWGLIGRWVAWFHAASSFIGRLQGRLRCRGKSRSVGRSTTR